MLERSVALLHDLIAYPTVSTDSNLDMIADLESRLSARGARTFRTTDETGGKANLFATLGPEAPGGLMLSGHTDVVPVTDQDWATDPFELVTLDDRLYGRGTCDMKGFIAATLAFAETLDPARLRLPLHFAFTHDEEVGCLGAQHLIEALKDRDLRPAMAIIGEPTEMRVIEGHKGCHEYTTRFTGLDGHGSAPDAGVNAVEFAARYVTRLLALREVLIARAPPHSRFEPPWTTLNIGRFSGGMTHNIIAGRAEVDWEMRPVQTSDADFVKTELARYCADTLLPAMRAVHPDADIAMTTIGEVAGLDPMEVNTARDLVSALTGATAADVVAFGTEAGLFQGLGTDVVVCGPGSIRQAHKPNEYLKIGQLRACCDMLGRLGRHLTS